MCWYFYGPAVKKAPGPSIVEQEHSCVFHNEAYYIMSSILHAALLSSDVLCVLKSEEWKELVAKALAGTKLTLECVDTVSMNPYLSLDPFER